MKKTTDERGGLNVNRAGFHPDPFHMALSQVKMLSAAVIFKPPPPPHLVHKESRSESVTHVLVFGIISQKLYNAPASTVKGSFEIVF